MFVKWISETSLKIFSICSYTSRILLLLRPSEFVDFFLFHDIRAIAKSSKFEPLFHRFFAKLLENTQVKSKRYFVATVELIFTRKLLSSCCFLPDLVQGFISKFWYRVNRVLLVPWFFTVITLVIRQINLDSPTHCDRRIVKGFCLALLWPSSKTFLQSL